MKREDKEYQNLQRSLETPSLLLNKALWVLFGSLLYLQALLLFFLISVEPDELIGYCKIERQVQHLFLA